MMMDEVPIENRDFTNGQATSYMQELKSLGACFIKSQDELLTKLNISLQIPKQTSEVSSTMTGHLKGVTLSGDSEQVKMEKLDHEDSKVNR